MRELEMGAWDIVSPSDEGLSLTLSLCTGLFTYQMARDSEEPKQGAPYLVTHNPTLPVLGMNPSDDMLSAMVAEEFASGEGKYAWPKFYTGTEKN